MRKVIGGWFLAVALGASAQAQMSPPVPPAVPPSKCTGPVHNELDFLLGEWEVYKTDNPEWMIGASSVDKGLNNCAIRETWKPFTMLNGFSVNSWDKHRKVWRTFWFDADNSIVEYEGGMQDGKMVLTGLWRGLFGPAEDGLMRMSYEPLSNGSVRQIVTTSVDQGKTWQPAFDFTYKRRRSPP
jgi:hypothetical protein